MNAEYDWLSLDADEEVLWADTPHPYSLVPAFVVGIPLAIVVVGLVLIAAAYLSHKNTNYVVTDEALYKKTGVLSQSVRRIEFDKVQDTSYRQSFLGGQFDYGSVYISTAGGSGVEMTFENVEDPQRLQSLVNERITGAERRDSTEDGKAAVLDEILAELRAIRGAIEGSAVEGGTGSENVVGGKTDGTTDSRPSASNSGNSPEFDAGRSSEAPDVEDRANDPSDEQR